jgi:hypothetical protein
MGLLRFNGQAVKRTKVPFYHSSCVAWCINKWRTLLLISCSVQLQTGLEKLKRRGRGMKLERPCYWMWIHIDRNWPAFRRNPCSGRTFLRNTGNFLHGYTASQSIKHEYNKLRFLVFVGEGVFILFSIWRNSESASTELHIFLTIYFPDKKVKVKRQRLSSIRHQELNYRSTFS